MSLLAPIYSSRPGHHGPSTPYIYDWSKLVVWGSAVFAAAVFFAWLRHANRLRRIRAQREVVSSRNAELSERWVKRARVVDGKRDGDSVVLAESRRRGSTDALEGTVLELDDGRRVRLREGVPVVGIVATRSVDGGTRLQVARSADDSFWIAGDVDAEELVPLDDKYTCGVCEPPLLGEAVPPLPRFRPWPLAVYVGCAAVIALLPIEIATTTAFVCTFGWLGVDVLVTAMAYLGGHERR